MSGSGRNRELLNESERLASRVLVPFAGDVTVNEVSTVSMDIRLWVVSSDKVECAALVTVSCNG